MTRSQKDEGPTVAPVEPSDRNPIARAMSHNQMNSTSQALIEGTLLRYLPSKLWSRAHRRLTELVFLPQNYWDASRPTAAQHAAAQLLVGTAVGHQISRVKLVNQSGDWFPELALRRSPGLSKLRGSLADAAVSIAGDRANQLYTERVGVNQAHVDASVLAEFMLSQAILLVERTPSDEVTEDEIDLALHCAEGLLDNLTAAVDEYLSKNKESLESLAFDLLDSTLEGADLQSHIEGLPPLDLSSTLRQVENVGRIFALGNELEVSKFSFGGSL